MSEKWKATARSMFASFKEVVATGVILRADGEPVYNQTTGTMDRATRQIDVPVIEFSAKHKLNNPSLWQEGDYTVMIGTFDLTEEILTGDVITYTPPNGFERSAAIVQVSTDDMGTGAFVYGHMRVFGG